MYRVARRRKAVRINYIKFGDGGDDSRLAYRRDELGHLRQKFSNPVAASLTDKAAPRT
jgi:hypothetical protein